MMKNVLYNNQNFNTYARKLKFNDPNVPTHNQQIHKTDLEFLCICQVFPNKIF